MKKLIRNKVHVGICCFVLLLCVVGSLGFLKDGAVPYDRVSAAGKGKVFTFNGKNLDKFNGEKTFIINCDTTTAHADQIAELYETKYKKFLKVTKVEYGPKATKVRENFLTYFMNMKTLVLGKNIKQASDEKWNLTYYGSPLLDYSLERIEVKKGNKKYTAKDGVLYNKKMTMLIKLPGNYKGKSYVMPETVQSMYNKYTITYGRNMEQITISRIFNGNLDNLNYYEKLKQINVVEGNPHFYTLDGVLYNQAQTKMICVPAKLKATELHFPDTLKKLDLGNVPETLVKINIPRDCTKVYLSEEEYEDSNLFWFLEKLQEITVSPGNTVFQAIDGVLYSLDGVTLIAYPAAKTDKEYTIPDEVVTIADDAITDKCKNLERLVIGKKVKYWDFEYSTDGAPEVAEFVVAPENLNFSSENGVLYSKDKKILLVYPKKNQNTSFTIGKQVEEIDTENFKSDYLTTITIDSSKMYGEDLEGLNGYFLPKLESFSVKASKNLNAVDGVLYGKNELVSYPAQKKNATYKIPDFVKYVDEYSIVNNSYLKKIVLGKKVSSVDNYAMGYGCKKLASYGVDKKNKYFSVKDGILYDKGKKYLAMYPFGKKAKTLTILKSVQYLYVTSDFLAKTSLKQFKLEKGNSYFKLNKKKNKLTNTEYGNTYVLKYKKDYYTEFEQGSIKLGGYMQQDSASENDITENGACGKNLKDILEKAGHGKEVKDILKKQHLGKDIF